MKRWRLWLSVTLLAAAAPLWAQPVHAQEPLSWSALSAQQQQVLGSMHDQWDSLPPGRQQALARGASRWLSMTPQQRSSARDRFQSWQRLPPGQRALIRQRWQQFQRLNPQQRAAIRQNFNTFSRLPPAERMQLRQRWLNASPAERQSMLERMRQQRGMRGPGPGRMFRPGGGGHFPRGPR
jgi:acyl-CoA reductase-like NAD-dependent aldehyde dehydrogenase